MVGALPIVYRRMHGKRTMLSDSLRGLTSSIQVKLVE